MAREADGRPGGTPDVPREGHVTRLVEQGAEQPAHEPERRGEGKDEGEHGPEAEVEPADRYATASEMADDLRRYLRKELIQARRPSARTRVSRFVRRYRTAVGAAAMTLLLSCVVTSLFLGAAVRSERVQRQRLDRPQVTEV